MAEVEWRRLRADQLRAAAATPAMVILPLAAIEQHGPHLPVEVDATLVEAVALATARSIVAQGGHALVLPVLWAGVSEHHMSLGGTITLESPLFIAVIEQVCRSVARHGFRRIVLLNGHGGNEWAMRVAADGLTPALGFPVVGMTYWNAAASAIAGLLTAQTRLLHACEAETSLMLALRPDLVATDRYPQAQPLEPEMPGVHRWRTLAERSPSGVIGTPAEASAEKGRKLLAAIAAALAEVLLRPALWT
jgi:creatinine amidohydrolase